MTIGVVGNITKPSLPKAVETLLKAGKKYQLEFFLHRDLYEPLKKKLQAGITKNHFLLPSDLVHVSDLIVAFGGDGTILSAVRMVGKEQTPILGINLGKLGFLAEASLKELEPFIRAIVQERHVIEERSLLAVNLERKKNELTALNEVVIDKSSSSRVIHLSVYVDNDYLVSFQGDGVIVSTPTGSTGYALAAGGPIISPASNVVVIQPISPHSLSARTVIVPDTSSIRVVVEGLSEYARVTADGQAEKTFSPPMTIHIQKAGYTAKLVKKKNRSYYDVLRAKLLWGRDIRLLQENVEQ
jgi:NAD+ kinase